MNLDPAARPQPIVPFTIYHVKLSSPDCSGGSANHDDKAFVPYIATPQELKEIMPYRLIVVGLMTVPLVMGAYHHRPLWIFVFTVPPWLYISFRREAARVQRETCKKLREALLRRPVETEE